MSRYAYLAPLVLDAIVLLFIAALAVLALYAGQAFAAGVVAVLWLAYLYAAVDAAIGLYREERRVRRSAPFIRPALPTDDTH